MLPVKYIRIFLVLVAFHSFVVAINLIMFPPEWIMKFGFGTITNNFFKVQGGVFHIVMVVAYLLAAWKPVEYNILIVFAITAKSIATLFLVTYYLADQSTVMILLSAVMDCLMAAILYYFYKKTDFTSIRK